MKLVYPLLKAALFATCWWAVLSLTSCNTFSGLGRDIQNTGSALRNAADQ